MLKIPKIIGKDFSAVIMVVVIIIICFSLTVFLNDPRAVRWLDNSVAPSKKKDDPDKQNMIIKRDLAKNPQEIMKDSYDLGQAPMHDQNEYKPLDLNMVNFTPYV